MDERIIKAKLDHIRRSATVRRWSIGPWEARTADHLAPGEYQYDADWERMAENAIWPPGKTLFLRTRMETPPGKTTADLFLEFDIVNLEGVLRIDGRPHAGIDANHTRSPIPKSGKLDLEIEFACLGTPPNRPTLQRDNSRLREVALIQVDPDVLAAFYDLSFTWEAGLHAPDERRQKLLHAALEEALLSIDLTAPVEHYRRDLAAARQGLQRRVNAIAPDPEAGRVFLTGHSHIDVAWLWPLRETVRKCERTFSTACRLLERYPDYHFSCSQPQLYAYTREYFPALYQEIKGWIRKGRWECTGGMWVEPDCNVPSGESLIRQILYGLAFFRDEFGVRPRTCWLPDVFGYPASLPGLLKGCGLASFFTCKLHWQARNPFPHHLFWWEGIDGTRVLAHIPRLMHYYNGQPTPEQLRSAWDNFQEKDRYPELLLPFGYGDGGGGPTEEMLEFAARARDFPGAPVCRQGGEEAYFDDVLSTAPDLSVWVGELYLETHRGTYTTHGEAKRANRKNELLLREAEIFGSLANLLGGEIDLNALRSAWSNLLLLQFHDILPGSSIGQVYQEAAEDYARIEQIGRRVRDDALNILVEQVDGPGDLVAFNSLAWARTDVARAVIPDPGGDVEIIQPGGGSTPAQTIAHRDGQIEIAFALDHVPSMGHAALSVRPATRTPKHSLEATERRLENRFFSLKLTAEGTIERLWDKRHERDVIAPGETANRLQLFQDGPEREAAWNVHATFEKREYAWDPGTEITVVETGPVRAVVRVSRHYRESHLEQDIILYDTLPRIDFVTRVDWQERQVMLKAAFPLAVRAMRGTFEIQFGAIERPTHRNSSWDQEKFEVCGHRWADLSEAGYGVSLLNDCKYGYDVKGNTLRLTLLRGPESPDPDADRGAHEFTYALFPHAGDWVTAETVRRAWELNVPIVCTPGTGRRTDSPDEHATFKVEGPALLETVKPAEDGDGYILRLYEPHGGRGPVRVHTPLPLERVIACNHVEENGDEWPTQAAGFDFPIGPFEIKTFRVNFQPKDGLE